MSTCGNETQAGRTRRSRWQGARWLAVAVSLTAAFSAQAQDSLTQISGMIATPGPVYYSGGQPVAIPASGRAPTEGVTVRWVEYVVEGNQVVQKELAGGGFCAASKCDALTPKAYVGELERIQRITECPSGTQCATAISGQTLRALPCSKTTNGEVVRSSFGSQGYLDGPTYLVRRDALATALAVTSQTPVNSLPTCKGFVLEQAAAPFAAYSDYLQSGTVAIAEDIQSLLVNRESWAILARSKGVISLHTAYLMPTKGCQLSDANGIRSISDLNVGLEQHRQYFLGCGLGRARSEPIDGCAGTNCSAYPGPWTLSPFAGAEIRWWSGWVGSSLTAAANGSYIFNPYPFPGTGWNLGAWISFRSFNPRVPTSALIYIPGPSGIIAAPSEGGTPTPTSLLAITASTFYNPLPSYTINGNFAIDTRLVHGNFVVRNELPNYQVGGPIAIVDNHPEPPGPDVLHRWRTGQTAYSVEDFGGHRGLVSQLSASDLRDSTIYVFRQSDQKLMGERWPLWDYQVGCDLEHLSEQLSVDLPGYVFQYLNAAEYRAAAEAIGIDDPQTTDRNEGWRLDYVKDCDRTAWSRSWMPAGSITAVVHSRERFITQEFPQPALGLEIDYTNDEGSDTEFAAGLNHGIRAGDVVKVVVVNHATGYIGTAEFESRGAVGHSILRPRQPLVLRPPNLRVWAERSYKVQAGQTDGDSRNYLIGSGGSALENDEAIKIHTEWLDYDGSPLPADLPGYTGRLSFSRTRTAAGQDGDRLQVFTVSDVNNLDNDVLDAPVNGAGRFSIQPGTRLHVVHLPDRHVKRHLYVHVDGAPLESHGSDTQPPTAVAGTYGEFSTNQVCYWEPVQRRTITEQVNEQGSAIEQCDDRDNDFDGEVDEGCPPNPCNGIDDDHDEVIDEGGESDPSCSEYPMMPRCVDRVTTSDAGLPTGPHPEILDERPWTYVPIRVPFYDAATTERQRAEAAGQGQPEPGPHYEFLYRPEYHVSLLQLEQLDADRVMEDAERVTMVDVTLGDVREGENEVFEGNTVDLDLRVLEDQPLSELERLDGERQLILDYGGTPIVLEPEDLNGDGINDGVYSYSGTLTEFEVEQLTGLYLLQAGDEGNVLFEYEVSHRGIEVRSTDPSKTQLGIGDSIRLEATLIGAVSTDWERVNIKQIEPKPGSQEAAGITHRRLTDRVFEVTSLPDAEETKVVFEFSEAQYPDNKKQVQLNCGCNTCDRSGGGQGQKCDGPGASRARTGNPEKVDIDISLGTCVNGGGAGTLNLNAAQASGSIYDPNSLQVSSLGEFQPELIYDQGVLDQIVSCASLVRVEVQSESEYSLKVYSEPQPATNSAPDTTFVISNPDPNGDRFSGRLHVLEVPRDGATVLNEYTRQEDGRWTLKRSVGGDDNEVLETLDISEDEFGKVHTVRAFHPRRGPGGAPPGPSVTQQVIEEKIVDVGGNVSTIIETRWEGVGSEPPADALEVTWDLLPDGRLQRYRDSSGTDTQYSYVAVPGFGLLLESETTSYGEMTHVTTYDYSAEESESCTSVCAATYGSAPRRITETLSAAGQTVVTSDVAYRYGREGDKVVQAMRRCSEPEAVCSVAGGTGLLEVRHYYPESTTAPVAQRGRLASVSYPDGRHQEYTYVSGTWSKNEFSVPSTGPRSSVQTVVVHGTVGQPAGVPGVGTRETTVVDGHGNAVYAQTDGLTTAGNWVTLEWSRRHFNSDGRIVEAVYSDGTSEQSEWNCCTLESSTDRRGVVREVQETGPRREVLVEVIDGVTHEYVYDGLGRVVSTTRSAGGASLTSTTHYDHRGRVDAMVDTQGRTTSYSYAEGPSGTVTTAIRPGGTNGGSATEVTDAYPDGAVRSVTGSGVVNQQYSYELTGDGMLQTTVCGGGGTQCQTTAVDMLGRTRRVISNGGDLTINYFYDAAGRLSCEVPSVGPSTCYQYDPVTLQQVGSFVDVNEKNQTYDVGERRQGTRQLLKDGSEFGLNGAWNVSTQTVGPEGAEVTTGITGSLAEHVGDTLNASFAIDPHGNKTESITTRAAFQETRTTTRPDGSVVTAISSTGRVRDVFHLGTGVHRAYGYDGLGRRTTVTDARTGAVTTAYNSLGQVASVTQEDSGEPDLVTTFVYDAAGRKAGEKNAEDKWTYFAYDDRGQLTKTWGNVPYPVKYEYDSAGRRIGMWTYRSGNFTTSWDDNAVGDKTTWNYDAATGWLLSKVDAAGNATVYTYYPDGKLESRRWARGGTTHPITHYTYYPTGELRKVDYLLGTSLATATDDFSTPDVEYTYDALGRVLTVTDALGTRTMDYDPQTLQLTDEVINGTGDFDGVYDVTLHRKYQGGGTDEVPGRAGGVQIDGGTNYDVTYGYEDGTGRFNGIVFDVGGQTDTVSYGYLEESNLLKTMATASGQTTSYGYEPHRDLKTQVSNSFNGSVVSQFDYAYDAIGRRTSVENSGSAFAAPAFTSWGYDDRNQVTGSTRTTGTLVAPLTAVTDEARSYSYDPIGNRLAATQWDDDTSSLANLTYSPNSLNQYDHIDGVAPQYDLDGNMTADDSGMTLTYNGENRLVRAERTDAWVSTFTYDYLGRRVKKAVDSDHDGVWDYRSYFVYDGWNVIREVREDNGGATSTKRYVWGLDLSQSMQGAGGIGGLLAVVDGDQSVFTFDGNGNVSELLDGSTGAEQAHYEYDAFGNVVVANGPGAEGNAWRFSTKPVDEESGYSYYGYRWYVAELGRWNRKDPMREFGGLNLYGFASNSATSAYDAVGLRVGVQTRQGTVWRFEGREANALIEAHMQIIRLRQILETECLTEEDSDFVERLMLAFTALTEHIVAYEPPLSPAAGVRDSFLDRRTDVRSIFSGTGRAEATSRFLRVFPQWPSRIRRAAGRIPGGDRVLPDESQLLSVDSNAEAWTQGTSRGRRFQLLPETVAALRAMRQAAEADGINLRRNLRLTSAYRNDAHQMRLYQEQIALASDQDSVAAPGGSEHRTGYAVDLMLGGHGPEMVHDATMRGTDAFRWLQNNDETFGFNWLPTESWHYSYHITMEAP